MSGSVDAGRRRRRAVLGWALAAALGSFLMGYQIGVISGALLFIRRDFGLSNFEQGALVGLLPLGALFGGLVAGRLADRLGRRRTLIVDALVLTTGIALSVAAPTYGLLLGARTIVGLGVGAAASTIPLYLSEISPPQARGRLVTIHQLMITLGILTSYCIDLIFAGAQSWRAMFAIGMLPAIGLGVGMLRSPESPAWLYARNRVDEAQQIVRQVAGGEESERLLEDLRQFGGVQADRIPFWKRLGSSARPALVIGVALAAALQLCGINAVIAYGPSIIEHTGLSASDSIFYSVAIGIVNVVATLVSIRLVDRNGRRPLLLGSLAAMCVSLVLLGLTFVVSLGAAESWLAIACILAFIASFAVGMGPIFWVLIAELFPLDARAAGVGVATAANWFFNFVVGVCFLPVANAIGMGEAFWVFAAICVLAFAFASRYVPETKGRTFSEIGAELRERWGRERAQEVPAY
jgi:MFS transporter, SP family, galactose:H+ symporter